MAIEQQTVSQRDDDERGKERARTPAALRQSRIIASFETNPFVSIAGLSNELGVSGMTVRRDLDALDKRGLLTRTHGGAVPLGTVAKSAVFDEEEPAFEQRLRVKPTEKSAIAQAAADLVGAGESVGLDVGTSILMLARLLAPRRDLRIFTNSLRVGMTVAEGNSSVHILGGQVRGPEYSTVGSAAVESLKSHFLDRVFIGVSGIDGDGFYDYSPEDTEVKRAFIESAEQVVVLCDSSKFNRRALSRISSLDKVNMLITDSDPTEDLALLFEQAGVKVVVANHTKASTRLEHSQ
jgi:DeoR/GlpR family transcriptional regulator of sugar metabolism